MPEIRTTRDDVKAMRGLHLFHFAMSNCSQRVRMALAEKGRPWTSHYVDLTRNEHATPGFQALDPKGVVPVLVHDRRTVHESNDIITYIDENVDGPRLTPESPGDAAFAQDAIRVTDGIQPAVKLLSHEFLLKPFRRMNPRQLEEFAQGSQNEALVQFMRDFSSREGFGRARIEAAVSEFTTAFAVLEERLAANPWLSGPDFGIADISWIVNVHRVATARYPLARFPRLHDWYVRTTGRPSFRTAVTAYEDHRALVFLAVYSRWRVLRGTVVTDYL